MESVNGQYVISIGGVNVLFPYPAPYPAQMQMMEAMLESLKNKENALLESPTGSGKSMATLCAPLAFLMMEENRIKLEFEKKRVVIQHRLEEIQSQKIDSMETDSPVDYNLEIECLENKLKNLDFEEKQTISKLPKIYFATRTHSQVKQIGKELSRTGYNNTKMTILGSRDQYCVHQSAKKFESGVNEACKHLCAGRNLKKVKKDPFDQFSPAQPSGKCQCSFRSGVRSFLENSSNAKDVYGAMTTKLGFNDSTWDIEDLVRDGAEAGLCPYYSAKSLIGDARIIFCPYDYLLDKKIRKSMGIEIEGQIIIFDEAHNIESGCRDSVSIKNQQDSL